MSVFSKESSSIFGSTIGSPRDLGSESVRSSFDDLTDKELVNLVEKIKKANIRMQVENDVWFNFLKKFEPKLLKGMEKMLNYASIVASSNLPKLTSCLSLPHSGGMPQRAESLSSLASGSSLTIRKSSIAGSWLSGNIGLQKLNLVTKTELAKREKERLENQITSFVTKSKLKRISLRAQLEELALQLAEIKEARDIFEQTICREGVDPITGRIPAEKFIRYMEEWLKSADSIIEKLRLRTSTLHYKYISLRKQLATKEELGESIHPVDFDVMKIQNKVLVKTIDDKNIDLLKLKQKVGEVNLLLAKSQRTLQKQLKDKNIVQENIIEAQQAKDKIDQENEMVESEFLKSEKNLNSVKDLIQNYTVPELLEYIKIKKDLEDLRKDIKIWTRRSHLQKIAFASCIRKMKILTGSQQEKETWFHPVPKKSDDSI